MRGEIGKRWREGRGERKKREWGATGDGREFPTLEGYNYRRLLGFWNHQAADAPLPIVRNTAQSRCYRTQARCSKNRLLDAILFCF